MLQYTLPLQLDPENKKETHSANGVVKGAEEHAGKHQDNRHQKLPIKFRPIESKNQIDSKDSG